MHVSTSITTLLVKQTKLSNSASHIEIDAWIDGMFTKYVKFGFIPVREPRGQTIDVDKRVAQ